MGQGRGYDDALFFHAPAVEEMRAEIMNQIKYLDDTFDYAPFPERSLDFGW